MPVPEKHSCTHALPDHQTSFINFLNFNLRAWQSFSTTSLQHLFGFLSVWGPLLHTPCISSPSHHLLFTAHAHTIAACSAVIPVLCHLFLIALSAAYLEILAFSFQHEPLTDLSTSHVRCSHYTLGTPKKVICQQYYSYTLLIIYKIIQFLTGDTG